MVLHLPTLRKKGKTGNMDTLRTPFRRRRFLFCLALFAFLPFPVVCAPCASQAAARLSPEMERYYRAVYVLQCFGGPAAEEKVAIPPRVRRSDEAESLRFHPDRLQVLRNLADDLAELAPHIPEARLFEAYARLSLGRHRQAAVLLSR